MKKTYITPETLVVRLMPVGMIAMSLHDEIGDGQLSKEYAGDNGSSSEGAKNVWDEEW